MYINEWFMFLVLLHSFKKKIKPTYKKISFLPSTSISATGYKRNTGENIAIIVNIFFGTFFTYEKSKTKKIT